VYDFIMLKEVTTKKKKKAATSVQAPRAVVRTRSSEETNAAFEESSLDASQAKALMSLLKEQTGVDFELVNLEQIEFADYNPNRMEEKMFDRLQQGLERMGGVAQTPIFRPHDDPAKAAKGWRVCVDGEHRVRGEQSLARHKYVLGAVVPQDRRGAMIETLAMNHVRGQDIPARLAQVLKELMETGLTPAQIENMAGIDEGRQIDVLKMLEVPDFASFGDEITSLTSGDEVVIPIQVPLLLMPGDHASYTKAMEQALTIVGQDVVPLIGEQVDNWKEALRNVQGASGVKVRNVAFACLCHVICKLPEEQLKAMLAGVGREFVDRYRKRMS
jgi:hypothetical protein